VAITVVLPRAASRCARIRSNSLTLAHSLGLARSPARLPEIAHTRFPARWLALARTRLLSLELSRTPSPRSAKPYLVFTLFIRAIPSMNLFAVYLATKFCENILIGVGDVTANRN